MAVRVHWNQTNLTGLERVTAIAAPTIPVMDYPSLAILFLAIAIVLAFAEVFIPSSGMISILAVISLAVSIWCAWKAWWETSPVLWWSYVAAVLVLLPTTIGGAFFLLARTRVGRRVLLEAPTADEVRGYVQQEEHLKLLLGKKGQTLTMLNPGGLVSVNGERHHCESEGMIIDPRVEVLVVAIKGSRLLVRRVASSEESAPPQKALADEKAAGPHEPQADVIPLDFDLPEG